jgi:hypothetical protein
MKSKSTYMGTAFEKLCLQNNVFVIWEFSFIGTQGVKKEGVLINVIEGTELKRK